MIKETLYIISGAILFYLISKAYCFANKKEFNKFKKMYYKVKK